MASLPPPPGSRAVATAPPPKAPDRSKLSTQPRDVRGPPGPQEFEPKSDRRGLVVAGHVWLQAHGMGSLEPVLKELSLPSQCHASQVRLPSAAWLHALSTASMTFHDT